MSCIFPAVSMVGKTNKSKEESSFTTEHYLWYIQQTMSEWAGQTPAKQTMKSDI